MGGIMKVLLGIIILTLVGCGKSTFSRQDADCKAKEVESGVKLNCGETEAFIPNGKDGNDGKDGSNGLDGVQGHQGAKGAKGDKGERGNDGNTGPVGPRGVAGERGADGVPGSAGTNGTNGVDGNDGADGQNGTGLEVERSEFIEECNSGGTIISGANSESYVCDGLSEDDDDDDSDDKEKKEYICHDGKTQKLPESAAESHLENHENDYAGKCDKN